MPGKVESVHQQPVLREERRRITNRRIQRMGAEAVVDDGDSSNFLVLVGRAPFVEGAFYAACGEGAGFGDDAWYVVVEGWAAMVRSAHIIVLFLRREPRRVRDNGVDRGRVGLVVMASTM